jgi:hypothetical protein
MTRTLSAGLVLIVLALAAPTTAAAQTYRAWSCAGPDGRPASVEGWSGSVSAPTAGVENRCGAGDGLRGWLDGNQAHAANATSATWHFQAPAATSIRAYRIWRSAYAEPSSASATPIYTFAWPLNEYNGNNIKEQCRQYAEPCSQLGDPARPFSSANLISATRTDGARDLYMNAGCGGSNGYTCNPETGAGPEAVNFHMYRAEFTLEDRQVPAFRFPPVGPLLQGGVLSGEQSVSISATDVGGGLLDGMIEVDGRTLVRRRIDTNGGRCVEPFKVPVPCKPAADATLRLDTTQLVDGPHAVRVLVSDATKTNVASYGPVQVTTSNAPNACAAEGTPAAASVSAGLGRRRTRTIRYGGRLVATGRVVNAAGQPLANVPVFVVSRLDRTGARYRLLPTPGATTAADGTFSYRVPRGPSRTLRFGHRAGAALPCSPALRVKVRARVTLRAAPRRLRSGGRVRLRGRLQGGHIPGRGKLIDLQAFDGGRWREFDTVRTRRNGRFRTSYRFGRGARGRFPMRVRVRPDSSYPFALGYSRTVRVRVG